MAKYRIKHSCGHESCVSLVGPARYRDAEIKRLGNTVCEDCFRAERELINAEAATANKDAGLPELVGTPNQIKWAEKIRHEFYKASEDIVDEDSCEAFGMAYNMAKASWWIDHRDALVPPFFAIKEFLLEQLKKEKENNLPEAIAAHTEATVRPKSAKTETVATISIYTDQVKIVFPEFSDLFRETVKRLGYRWHSDRYWYRQMSRETGAATDRAAEAGHHLLAAGFVVCIHDPDARHKAVSGKYKGEQTRWIGAADGAFQLSWAYGEDYYRAARKIPGSRYKKPFVTVPRNQFQQLLDFAERYRFSMHAEAQALAEQAKKERDATLIAKVDPPRKKKRVADVSPPKIIAPKDVGIDADLLDDD